MKKSGADRQAETSGSLQRSRGRPKVTADSDQARAIAQAAWHLFVENGYGGTAMSDVAAAARVSLRTVYRLFPAKPDLFKAVVELHRHSMLALPGSYDDCPFDEALCRIFQIDIDPEAEKARSALMTFFIVEGRQFPELGALVREFGADRSRSLLAAWLMEQHGKGRACIPDPEIAAKMLMDIAFGAVALKSGTSPQWPGGVNRSDYLRRCFSLVSVGLAPADGHGPEG